MTNNCPDKECRNKVIETYDAIFKNHAFVSKKFILKTIIPIIIIIGVPLYITMANIWANDKVIDQKLLQYVTVSEFKESEIDRARLEEQFKALSEKLDIALDQQKKNTQEILESIKRINR